MSRVGHALAIGFVVFVPICARAQTHGTHVVQDVFLDGKAVASAPSTLVRGATVARTVHRGEIIQDGTRVDVPAHVVLVVANVAKSKVTLQPGSSVTFVNTGAGELVKSNRGLAIFSVVPKALDFYRVQSSEVLTASVHGTEFSVSAAGDSVTFTCRQGEINVTKTGYLSIGGQRTKTSLIDVISSAARAQATYTPSLNWSLAKFENFAQAEQFYQRQLHEAQDHSDTNAINVALLNLGNVQRAQGRYADAFGSFSQARAFYQKGSDLDRQAQALEGLGLVLLDEDRYTDALGYLQQALQIFQRVGDLAGQADSLKHIGDVKTNRNEYREAVLAQRQARELYHSLGDVDGEARIRLNLGAIADGEGRHKLALDYFNGSLPVLESLGDLDGAAYA
ncbi:MAG: tetratricopeptide repeat protein, partial [Candidatus Eremiobacteraeota bacterium]|nr:tetratricopeptide repeat protein [Candidatus Eremiobacteraeota bacterium]